MKECGMMQVRPCQRSMYVVPTYNGYVYIFSTGLHIIQYALWFQEWDDVGDDNNDTVLSMLHFEPADSVMASVYQELSWTS